VSVEQQPRPGGNPGLDRSLVRALVVLTIVLIGAALCFGAVKLLGATSSACTIIVASIFVLYIMLPLIRRLESRMAPPAAFGVAFALFAAGAFLLGWALLPPVISQAQQFAASLPQIIIQAQRDLTDPNNTWLARLPPGFRAYVATLPDELGRLASKYGFTIAQHTFTILTSGLSVFLSVVIVPILTAYLFFDHKDLKRAALGFVPASWRPKAVAILADLNDVLGSFVRGQVLDGAIVGMLIFALLALTHVPFALLIAVLAGILNFIPYVGAIIGFIPSVVLALAYHGWQTALVVAVGFAVIQQVDGNVIVPRIMRSQVNLSPVLLIASILGFSALFGIVGTFIAVPVTAMLRVLKLHFAPAPSATEMAGDEALARALTKF
jgi:predicted PurR-regulated permease PerM